MKTKSIFLLCYLVSIISFAQQGKQQSEALKSERQRAERSTLFSENENPNTLNYDLRYVRLELDLDPSAQFVSGVVTSHFKMLSPSQTIYFDLSNKLKVSQVKYHNQNINFQHLTTKELKITFPASLPATTLDSLSITYSGVPDNSQDAFTTQMQGGKPVLATLSEPFGAKEWWPTKQSLNDKIEKLDIKITTPSQYSVAANGKLISETVLDSGKKMTFWQSHYPIPAYLVALGITNYVIINDTFGVGNTAFPFVNYLYPSTTNNASQMSNIQWTKACMALFEDYFGPYPFREEKYGHMQFNASGGMEHTTMSSMGFFSQGLIAHELAHQWFGDKVTCATWNDIWLNESFARFGEHLVNEKLLMNASNYKSFLSNEISSITAFSGGSVYIPDAEPSFNQIFNGRLTYDKGAYVLRMLRYKMGDNQFFGMLKAYHMAPQFSHAYATTAQFLDFLNAYTGENYNEFFNDWIFGQGYPIYTIKWAANANNVNFKISQTQSHSSVSFFEMPLPIKVLGANGKSKDLVLDHNMNNQFFSENVGFPVTSVVFNQDLQLLTKNASVTRDNNLGITEINSLPINIYPNPATTELFVSGIKSGEAYKVFSLDGKLRIKGILKNGQAIDISNLLKGEYIIVFNQLQMKFLKH